MTQVYEQNLSSRSEGFSVSTTYLQFPLNQPSQQRPLQENIDIIGIGCGYIGTALADSWRERRYCVTATTTHPERVAELNMFVNHVSVARGGDANAVQAVMQTKIRLP
jgi:UDP-N-acetyl-D-mannosaminuronate dehydrogenase